MGIDFSHGGAHWAYSGFHRFRERLSEAEGFDLNMMDGFGGSGVSWKTVETPLKPLLDHSDCDDDLSAEDCAGIWPRLSEIVETWPDGDFDKQEGRKLVTGMVDCARSGQRLTFR